jgi:hypothetical protein
MEILDMEILIIIVALIIIMVMLVQSRILLEIIIIKTKTFMRMIKIIKFLEVQRATNNIQMIRKIISNSLNP